MFTRLQLHLVASSYLFNLSFFLLAAGCLSNVLVLVLISDILYDDGRRHDGMVAEQVEDVASVKPSGGDTSPYTDICLYTQRKMYPTVAVRVMLVGA